MTDYIITFEIETEDIQNPPLTPQEVLAQFTIVRGNYIHYSKIIKAEIRSCKESAKT